jgi:hypothetical protein
MRAQLRTLLAPFFFFATLTATAPAAHADGGFRCGRKVVRHGDTESDVERKCGAPDATRSWTEVHTEGFFVAGQRKERSVPVTYTEWTYDFGRHKLIIYVTFVQGRSAFVKTGEYGGQADR